MPDHAASWISSRPAPETGAGGLWLYRRDGEGDLRSRGVRGVSRLETLSRAATALATAIYGSQETPFSASDWAECVACILLGKPPLVAPVDYQIGRPGGPLVLRVNFPISDHALNEAYRRCCEKLGWNGKKRAAPKARKIQAFLANPARQGLSRGKVLAQWNEAFPDDEFDAPETLFRYAYRSPSKRPTHDSLNATLEEQREEFRQVRDGLPGERG